MSSRDRQAGRLSHDSLGSGWASFCGCSDPSDVGISYYDADNHLP